MRPPPAARSIVALLAHGGARISRSAGSVSQAMVTARTRALTARERPLSKLHGRSIVGYVEWRVLALA
jgi:hypothetical protein